MEVIPAIDLLGGRCVRLFQGDFDQVSRYEQDPLVLAAAYRAAGARRLHVVDLDGARTGDPGNASLIARLAAESGLAVQAGGGIRDFERLRALLDAGAARAVIGSLAVEDPALVARWLEDVGPARVVLALDVRIAPGRAPSIVTRGWQQDSGMPLWSVIESYVAQGASEFLCTDVSRDGTLSGPNLDLYTECARRFPGASFIASGGVGSVADLRALAVTGVAAVVTGKALLDGRLTLEEMRSFSQDA
jgi:phosphoribosylformimino-5-aminoimidazole carboxamide ribotide isomerase